MSELERRGWPIALYPLIAQKQPVVHAEARPWVERAHVVPVLSGGVLLANGRALRHDPRRYLSLWGRTLWSNRGSPNFLARALLILPRAFALAQTIQQAGITHMHAHFATHPALMAWLLHQLTGISYSITVHAHDIFVRTTMLDTKVRDAAFVVAISAYNRDHLARVVGPWVTEKTHVVHCGVDPARYTARPAPPAPGERFEIITIGSLQPYKGQRHLIEACAQLRDQNVSFRCRIVGGGEEQARLESQIAESGLTGLVELLGPQPQDEVARLLPTAHCYVQPSIITPSGKMEGIPVALMEAMACSLPVVATAISGIPELVRPGETGFLVPPADAAALAQALRAVHEAPIEAFRIAQAGRGLVLDEFDLHANVAQLAALFATLPPARSPG